MKSGIGQLGEAADVSTTLPAPAGIRDSLLATSQTIRFIALAIIFATVQGCGAPNEPAPTPPRTIDLRFMPSDQGCDLVQMPGQVTFKIDPAAAEDVVAVSPTGKQFHVWWSKGFVGGRAEDRVVFDPNGLVVARDGQLLSRPAEGFPKLRGYTVCATDDSLYVFLAGPA